MSLFEHLQAQILQKERDLDALYKQKSSMYDNMTHQLDATLYTMNNQSGIFIRISRDLAKDFGIDGVVAVSKDVDATNSGYDRIFRIFSKV